MAPARADVPAALDDAAPLCWHPRLLAHTTPHGQVVLLEDGDAVLFEAGPTARVAQAVSAHASAREIMSMERSLQGQVALQVALDELVALDLVQPADAFRSASRGYIRPEIEAEPRVLGPPGQEVILLTELSEADPLVGWANEIAAAHRVAVAIVDDELDPRLEAIDRRRRAAAAPWLLWKPRGLRPSLGPWFSAETGSPCCGCLQRRMLSNQPVRRWLSQQVSPRSLAVPVAASLLAADLLPPPPLGRSLIEQLQAGALLQLEPGTAAITRAHHVAGSEHCRSCGEALREHASRSRPLDLRPTARRPDPDGGYRTHSADDTLARLSRHVSPVTGSVADVSIMPGGEAAHVPIHRSALRACPLASPIVRPADFRRIALGKGISTAQSRASALCEALERSVAQYRGDEPTLFAAAEALGHARVLPPPILRPLSPQQRASLARERARPTASLAAWRADEPIHWVDVDSLSRREPCKAPLTYCYANTPYAREEELCRFDSNGCAAGRTLEEALLQGLLEVIERDAVAIWWYNRLSVPSVPLSVVGSGMLDALQRSLHPAWDFWLLDVTHDLETPACVAVARRLADGQFRLGFGCHVEARLAAQRAAAELCQLIAIGEQRGSAFDFASVASEPYLHPPAAPDVHPPAAPDVHPPASTEHADIRDAIEACVARLAARGLEVLVHRYAAIDEALVIVKVIVPGACHIWPQLGAPRLYQVPVDRGWAQRPLAEHELNPLALFV